MTTIPGKTLYINAESFDIAVNPETLGASGSDELLIFELFDSEDEEPKIREYYGQNGPTGLRVRGDVVIIKLLARLGRSFPASGFRLRVRVSDCPVTSGFCASSPKQDICFTDDMMCDGKADCPGAADEQCPLGCGVPALSPIPSTKDTRILGGIDAKPSSWPWQVAFVDNRKKLLCAGSIIDHSWILTAAVCCDVLRQQMIGDTVVSALVGEHDLSNHHEPNAAMYPVDRLRVYPTGDFYRRWDDFCLVKTKSKMFFNDHVMPVCLPSVLNPPLNTTCYVTGWGISEEPQNAMYGSARLKQADLKIAAPDKCMGGALDLYPNALHYHSLRPSVICAENPGKESCWTDEGAPLVCRSTVDPSRWELVGITNSRLYRVCSAIEPTPQQFAKVSFALDWITAVIFNDTSSSTDFGI